jgi:hypothetical protein
MNRKQQPPRNPFGSAVSGPALERFKTQRERWTVSVVGQSYVGLEDDHDAERSQFVERGCVRRVALECLSRLFEDPRAVYSPLHIAGTHVASPLAMELAVSDVIGDKQVS